MEMLFIIKIKLLMIIRKQYEVTAKKLSEFFNGKISSTLIYLISFILSLNISVFICFLLQTIITRDNAIYVFSVVGGFFVLNSFVMGREAAKLTATLEEENILLYSTFSDFAIFIMLITEQIIAFLIRDFFLLIPSLFVISYLSDVFFDFIYKSIAFILFNFLIFSLSNFILSKKINKEYRSNNGFQVIVEEILCLGKFVSITILTYFISKIFILPVFNKRSNIKEILNSGENVIINNLNGTIGETIVSKKMELLNFIKSSILSLEIFSGHSLVLLLVITAVLTFIFILNSSGINYRKTYNSNSNKISLLSNYYINFLLKLSSKLFHNNFIIVKDLIILREKFYLIGPKCITQLIIPMGSSISFGFLIFLLKFIDDEIYIYTFAMFLVIKAMMDLTSIIRMLLPVPILINSEMQNIYLLKNSTYNFRFLLNSKINLMRLLMIIPTLIVFLQLLILMLLYKQQHTVLFLPVLIILAISFYIAPIFQLYGSLYFDKFNYKNYEELYENVREQKIFKKFFSIPSNLLVFPLLIAIVLNLFIDIPRNILNQIMLYYLIYFVIGSLIWLFISVQVMQKGEISLNEKLIEI